MFVINLVSFISLVLLFSSCHDIQLSEKIKKSQMRKYKEIDKMRLEFMNSARRFAFEELRKQGVKYEDQPIIHVIEAYDITNGNLDAVIIIGSNEYYYNGSHFYNKFSLETKPIIEKSIINSFINKRYKELSDSLWISSISYIGSSVKFDNKLKINKTCE